MLLIVLLASLCLLSFALMGLLFTLGNRVGQQRDREANP